jgi:Glycosyl transferase family 2
VPDLPLISALMPAFNAERFIGEAIQSALDQDYPADRLEVVVVDDGSTDATAEIVSDLAARHPGRVRPIRQANAGNVAATNTAVAAARGELLAILDSDDVWPVDKTRRQQALLAARPEVGLVYGDMRVIDASGRVLQESWLVGDEPPEGRFSAPMLLGNSATASSIMMRASLGAAIAPIPDGMPFNDWWFAVRAAQVAEIAYLPEPRTFYRWHGANLSLGAGGADRLRELRKTLRFQRWFLRSLEAGEPGELLAVWRAFEHWAGEVLSLAGSPFAELVAVTDADRASAAGLAAEGWALLERGAAGDAIVALVRAAACDPGCEQAREGVLAAAAAADPSLPGQRPLNGAGEFVVRADAGELLADPSLLAVYARGMAGVSDVTLAIDASELPPESAAQAIGRLAAATGLADDDSLDLLAVLGPLDAVGRARLAAGTTATYGAGRGPVAAGAQPALAGTPPAPAAPPAFTPATLDGLRALATGSPGGCARARPFISASR